MFIPFKDGKPSGPMEDFVTGFVKNEKDAEVYGRPAGVTFNAEGQLLVADDAGDTVWLVRPLGKK